MTSLSAWILLIVVGQIVYHFVARGSSQANEPFLIVAGAYFVAFVAVFSVGLLLGKFSLTDVQPSNLRVSLLIGLSVACVELGYLYAYKHGLPVGTGALKVLALSTLVLVPIGVFYFGEKLSLRLILGCLSTCVGIWIISTSTRSS